MMLIDRAWEPTAKNVVFGVIGVIWLVVVGWLVLGPFLSWLTTHFVITDDDVLISHAIAHGRALTHAGESWDVWGLSSVFTYPTHRGSGFGEQVVAAATQHIRQQKGADFALLFCGERVKSLYFRQGWQHLPHLRVHFGENQCFNDGYCLALLLTDRARAHDFSTEPLHVGPYTW